MLKLLTSRLAGPVGAGLSLLLAIALLSLMLAKNSTISALRKDLKTERENNLILRTDNQTLRGNAAGLEAGLSACSAGVDAVAKQADAVAKAGVIAVDAVKAAGTRATNSAAAILAMPRATCDDAFKILKAGGQP